MTNETMTDMRALELIGNAIDLLRRERMGSNAERLLSARNHIAARLRGEAAPVAQQYNNPDDLSQFAAPAPVAGDAVAALVAVWREEAYPVTGTKAARLAECADELEAALAQDRASQAGAAGVTREEAESFLAQYHAEVWSAAEAEEPSVAYDDAGRGLAEAFLARFGEPDTGAAQEATR